MSLAASGGEQCIEGVRVNLRPVTVEDAPFVFALRSDRNLTQHLNPIQGTVEDQRAWLAAYKQREAAGAEYYFAVETKGNDPCGLVRLYNIDPPVFTWGSVILGHNKPPKAALEVALLSMDFGFHRLDCEVAKLDVRRQNRRAIAFYERFGLRQTGEDEIDLYFDMTRDAFEARRPALERALVTGSV